MSKLTLAIPCRNQINDTKGILALMRHNTSEDTEFMIIDNGSTEPLEDFCIRYLRPKKMNFIRNEDNLGMIPTMQQIYDNCTTEYVAVVHNDVYIYEKDWDQHIIRLFDSLPKVGGIGLFGAQGCGPVGERIQDVEYSGQMAGMSNMLEAEIHGMRLKQEYRAAAIFDGFFMAFRKTALPKGFDQRYMFHHIYDRDASLEVLRNGFDNIVANIPCHHIGGITANRADYQEWIDKKIGMMDYKADKFTHDHNSEIFKKKWESVLPLYVNNDFSFRTGDQQQWKYKGDDIRRLQSV